jgi:hypothetical protein
MKISRRLLLPLSMGLLATLVATSVVVAMQRGWRGRGGSIQDGNRAGVPMWEVDDEFPEDVFVFARVQYSDNYGSRRGGKWRTDYPDSDLNFSLRLQQLTSLRVDPEPIVVRLTDEDLFDYPFLYLIEPGNMLLSEAEVRGLRKYLDNGGFLMIDDFWGDQEYMTLYSQLKRVFPEKEPEEVPLEHEIFHCVYDLDEKPQVPAINTFYSGRTYEPRYGSDTSQPSYQAIYDEAGRIMVFICHNTDLGDGWEKEGENHEYFQEFAVKKSYPMGINIVTYAMTH